MIFSQNNNIPVGIEIMPTYEQLLEQESLSTSIVGYFDIPRLDSFLSKGLKLGRLTSIVAPPGIGKSMIAIQLLHNNLTTGIPTIYATNEMTFKQTISRLITREMQNISYEDIDAGLLPLERLQEYQQVKAKLSQEFVKSNSMVIAKGIRNTIQAVATIKEAVTFNKAPLVILDHLNNLSSLPGQGIYDKISEAAHAFQGLAQENNIHVVLLCQMSSESRKSTYIMHKTPKGSGDVEEVSDLMLVLDRDRVDIGGATAFNPNNLKIIISKNRHGRTGHILAKVDFPSMRITGEAIY